MTEYCYYLDPEGYCFGLYSTKISAMKYALQDAELDDKDRVYIGEASRFVPYSDPERVLDDIYLDACDEYGDSADDWLSDVNETDMHDLGNRLNNILIEWLHDTGNEPQFFHVENVQEMTLEEVRDLISKPLGCDSLGRFVYDGDRIYWNILNQDEPWPPLHYSFDDVVKFEGFEWGTRINDSCTVDLEKSPKKTNYERYFADFMSFNEIRDFITKNFCDKADINQCINDINLEFETTPDTTKIRCPFVGWHKWIHTSDYKPCLENFVQWLKLEANV